MSDRTLSLDIVYKRSVILMCAIALLGVMKLAAPILVPVALAIFFIALGWPLKTWLNRHLPNSISYVGSFFAMALILSLFAAAFWFSIREIIHTFPEYQKELVDMVSQAKKELQDTGVETEKKVHINDLKYTIGVLFKNFNQSLFYFIMVVGYIILAMPEVASWRPKLHACLGKEESDKILSSVSELEKSMQSYLIAMLIAGAVSAIPTTLIAYATGLDFAITWGVLAFFLNFIPTIGAILMIIPPTLFALLQFDGMMMPLIVLLGFSVVQMFVGTVVDAKLQGGMLSISPVVILFSVALWGFLWGIPGALLATPLTHSIIIVCNHYPRTKWIACLLSSDTKALNCRT